EDLQSSRSIQSVYETARTSVEETPRDDNYRKFPSMTDLIREIRMEEGLAVTDRSIDNQSLPSTSFSSTSTNSSKPILKPTVSVISISDSTLPPTVLHPIAQYPPSSTFYRLLSSAPQNLFLFVTFTYTWFASFIIHLSRAVW
ncbi:hypothetical protein PFISCL1PPCAC_1972, partial [Pristionchus fissidentatus]